MKHREISILDTGTRIVNVRYRKKVNLRIILSGNIKKLTETECM